ncbi:MAG: hypothetical protein FWC86_01560 [Coriobacteriia bacterium]|nr:hypothetical protein [Coriobacteriia bacterium]
MKICPECSTQSSAAAVFCSNKSCGKAFQEVSPRPSPASAPSPPEPVSVFVASQSEMPPSVLPQGNAFSIIVKLISLAVFILSALPLISLRGGGMGIPVSKYNLLFGNIPGPAGEASLNFGGVWQLAIPLLAFALLIFVSFRSDWKRWEILLSLIISSMYLGILIVLAAIVSGADTALGLILFGGGGISLGIGGIGIIFCCLGLVFAACYEFFGKSIPVNIPTVLDPEMWLSRIRTPKQ